MNYYIYITTVLFLWLGVIWSSKTWTNMTFKTAFIALAVTGALLSMQVLGYVVKA